MIGRNPGCVTTQGEIVYDLLRASGYPVMAVSAQPNRYHRLLDIVTSLIRWRRRIAVQCLQVYCGPSFVVEDIASQLGRRFGHRIVMHLHGGAVPQFIERFPRWARRVLSRADGFVTPSKFLARALARLGYEAHVIPNVIDLSAYPYRHRERVQPRLLWMRTFHPIYNPLMALKVLQQLRREFPEATLVMAGQDDGLLGPVQQQARELGLAGAVRWPGFLDMKKKLQEGNAADIFINTNHIDNTPVGVIEAGALGLPVVATNVGGIPDLLTNEKTGLLVPDDDATAMAQAVRRLLREPDLATKLSAQGRQLAEDCSWERVRPQWEGLFEGLRGGTRMPESSQ
jgi:L-malate glycosyltransferase